MKFALLLASFLVLQDARPVGVITGQIRAMDGLPAAKVEVAAVEIEQYGNLNPATAILVSLGQTDAEGRYRLERVPPGRYSGNYSLRSYLRPCDGECRRLDPPKGECTATFSIAQGQVLNAERVMQGELCTIRLNTVP